MSIKTLPLHIINKIAAGQIIERPSCILKELIENAIDAGATYIRIKIFGGGKHFISVHDNGSGIKKDELKLALGKYTTSKVNYKNLYDIPFLGFRGEALHAITSISKVSVTSKTYDAQHASKVDAIFGKISEIQPSALNVGTYVEVRDMFFTVPARLKFLKSDSYEANKCAELVNRIALSRYDIGLEFLVDNIQIVKILPQNSIAPRISDLLGQSFFKEALKLSLNKNELSIVGFIYTRLLPIKSIVYNKEHFFVNNRFIIKNQIFKSAVDNVLNTIPYLRKFNIILYLYLNNSSFDINIHPTKCEIKFFDENLIKHSIIEVITNTLFPINSKNKVFVKKKLKCVPYYATKSVLSSKTFQATNLFDNKNLLMNNDFFSNGLEFNSRSSKKFFPREHHNKYRLGFARCYIGNKYIIAETKQSLIIVNQSVAYQRIVIEKLKYQIKHNQVSRKFITPKLINMSTVMVENIMNKKIVLQTIGLGVQRFSNDSIIVEYIPTLLKNVNIAVLIKLIYQHMDIFDDKSVLYIIISDVWNKICSHININLEDSLTIQEMNCLLRELENYKIISQNTYCRKVFFEIKLENIKKMFN